ncbi:hypothetical protein [Pararhizobium sp. A13]|uniref:hypothetical protein n=1 Tax=Pararhizobium sp. A13 TaxID=3133975 RepID=UPI00311B04DF
MLWKTLYLAFGFAMAVGVTVMLTNTRHEDASLVKTDRLNITPATGGFDMERFAG